MSQQPNRDPSEQQPTSGFGKSIAEMESPMESPDMIETREAGKIGDAVRFNRYPLF